jgi:hypothetical protein
LVKQFERLVTATNGFIWAFLFALAGFVENLGFSAALEISPTRDDPHSIISLAEMHIDPAAAAELLTSAFFLGMAVAFIVGATIRALTIVGIHRSK